MDSMDGHRERQIDTYMDNDGQADGYIQAHVNPTTHMTTNGTCNQPKVFQTKPDQTLSWEIFPSMILKYLLNLWA